MTEFVIGGIEGGATKSQLILLDGSTMRQLAIIDGPSSNICQMGTEETCKLLQKMVKEGLAKAGLPAETKLKSLGMSLSGCEREEDNVAVEECMAGMVSGTVYAVASDTQGTLATASGQGGIVLIAGTGSNALLVNPDGSTSRCGGWGHLIGDEGSAMYVATKAVKTLIDHEDNKVKAPSDITVLKAAVFKHFGIKDRFDIIPHCYSNFSKAQFAGLCRLIAEGADAGDALCSSILEENGHQLAAHLLAMAPDIKTELLTAEGGLPVVCIGSVWKAWKHLKDGFMAELTNRSNGKIKEIQLLQLKVPAAVGASYLGADRAKLNVKKSYGDNTEIFFKGRV